MKQADEQTNTYVLGSSERELARLEKQASFFADATRDVLTRAGLTEGMRVLDLGCGVGDVSLIAADLVGPTGSVLGIDVSADALAVAERRASAMGKQHVRFETSAIETFSGFADYDAVIGRFILVHMPDPAGVLSHVASNLKNDAILAMIEMDMSTAGALPPLPLLQQTLERIMDVYRRSGRQMDMGSHLFAAFRKAGLDPQLSGFTRIAAGSEIPGIGFVVESVRSLMPFMEKLAIATPADIDIDTLGQRLAEQAAGGEHCVFFPRLIGAWAAKGR
ncbi:class I SAM-dependent methyltransferase [Terrihabitans sp. B22-R8]|uniref:class I SAM-dependent methyltransferase n=1 Tax=Terrihabitans sp. B22-R8 TaxID=3425128 RepID=UPI00403CC173